MCFYQGLHPTSPSSPKKFEKKRFGLMLPAELLFSEKFGDVLKHLQDDGSVDPVDTLYLDLFSNGAFHLNRPEIFTQVLEPLIRWKGKSSDNNNGLVYQRRIFAWFRVMNWGSGSPPHANWLMNSAGSQKNKWLTPYDPGYSPPAAPAKPDVSSCTGDKCEPNVYLDIARMFVNMTDALKESQKTEHLFSGIHLDELRAPWGDEALNYSAFLQLNGDKVRESLACMACEIAVWLRRKHAKCSLSIGQLNLNRKSCLEEAILPLVKSDEVLAHIDDFLLSDSPRPDLSHIKDDLGPATRLFPRIDLVNNGNMIKKETLLRLYKESHAENGLVLGLVPDASITYQRQLDMIQSVLQTVTKEIKFTVSDDTGKKVKDAKVSILDPHKNKLQLTTDKDGKSSIRIVENETVVLEKVTAPNKIISKEPVIGKG